MLISELRDSGRTGCEYRTPVARILEAAIAIADADSEDDGAWHRNWNRLRKTLLDLGWTPPPSGGNDATDPRHEAREDQQREQ